MSFTASDCVVHLSEAARKLTLQDCPHHIYVANEEAFVDALNDISHSHEIAFDAEGVRLSRSGPLTLASFLVLDATAPVSAYLIDVQEIGAERVFSTTSPSLRAILEDPKIRKVTYDCRTDSDALFHQFGVRLTGVLELQVLDQAVRIQQGAPLPLSPQYAVLNCSYLMAMAKMAERHLNKKFSVDKLAKPHQDDPLVWGKRPLSEEAQYYAANDVYIIKELLAAMRKVDIDQNLMNGVAKHSARYESHFREVKEPILDRMVRLYEHPIVEEGSLQKDHPQLKPSLALLKWNSAIQKLQDSMADPNTYDEVLFVLQHRDWYTNEARTLLLERVDEYPHFTEKQKTRLITPPSFTRPRGGRKK